MDQNCGVRAGWRSRGRLRAPRRKGRKRTPRVYHRVVSPGRSPAIDKTADVAVDGLDVGSRAVDVVHEAGDRLSFGRLTVDPYWSGGSQVLAVGVMPGQIHQEVGVVPLLQFTTAQQSSNYRGPDPLAVADSMNGNGSPLLVL